jgi:bifunctional non-homologous end joining protein LigD
MDLIRGISSKKSSFVIQKHYASHLHYDFRLEINGVLKSWAIPKNPLIKIGEKRLAIETEDHPLDYARFSGVIPKGNYGAGKVEIWDKGIFENLKNEDISKSYKRGRIEIRLKGKRLNGNYALIRFKSRTNLTKKDNSKSWLFIREKKTLSLKNMFIL